VKLWVRAVLAALIVAVTVTVTVGVGLHYDLNAAASAATVVTALVALVVGLRAWLVDSAADQPGQRRAARAFVAAGTAVAVVAGIVILWVHEHPAPAAASCPTSSGTLRVLAGHSQYDDDRLAAVLDEAHQASGVTIQLGDQEGTIAAAEKILDTDLTPNYDAVWLPSNRYLLLDPRAAQKVYAPGVSIAMSPVVLGLQHAVARELGWDLHAPSWRDIAEAANAHEFTYGMTDPAFSNSALSALIAVNAAVHGDTTTLRKFFSGQVITSGSTGNLTDQYKRREETGDAVQGLISYESEILNLNPNLPPAYRLDLIYPSDGSVVADFPMTMLKPATAAAQARFAAVTCYLTSPAGQAAIATTNRRPELGTAPLPTGIEPAPVTQLPYPSDLATANSLLFDFRNSLRKPSRTIYVLDVSGSMCEAPSGKDGDACAAAGARRIDALVTALKGLAGADPNVPFAEQVTEFSRGEQIVLLPFSSQTKPPLSVNVSQDLAAGQRAVQQAASDLRPDGATFLYEALEDAYTLAGNLIRQDPNRLTSIVLLTDGEANGDKKLADFRTFYNGLRGTPQGSVRTFTIALGEANLGELSQIASLTTGLAYDTRQDSLTTIFFQIRGYV
jgi:Ca-activated chloride channel family protein